MTRKLIILLGSLITIILVTLILFWINVNSRGSQDLNISKISQESEDRGGSFFSGFSEKKLPPSPKFENPITGETFNTEAEPDFLSNTPIAVMINNAVPARPQSGLNKADIVYEIVAEGGITRFLAVFYSELPSKVGPVRSAREYYLNFVKELGDAMYMHIGYSPQALQRLSDWKIKTLTNVPNSFYRDNHGNTNVATEHTAYSNLKNLLEAGKNLNYNQKVVIDKFKFKNTISTEPTKAVNIEISFWYKGDYTSIFKYDPVSKSYVRYNGYDSSNNPIKSYDRDTFEEVKVKNLIVAFADEVPIPNDDKNRLDYKLIGEGKALFFMDGGVVSGTWKKNDLNSRTKYYNANGQEMEFGRGKFWVSIVPSRNEDLVVYE